jgi:peptidoglycan/LPS O-acetylase OafA/YrhL
LAGAAVRLLLFRWRGATDTSDFQSAANTLMQFFGTISYSFYLWHPIVTFPLKSAMTRILIGKLGEICYAAPFPSAAGPLLSIYSL